MTRMIRPCRSALFVPGSNERALAKAPALNADVLILDLEDSVVPDAKPAARLRIAEAVRRGGWGAKEIVVRVNELGSSWAPEDIHAAVSCGADAIVLPKVNSAGDIRELVRLLAHVGAPETLPVWAMIETPRGILHAEEIATADSRLATLVVGTNDLTKELRARHVPGRLPLLPALATCVLAARAASLNVLDGVFNDLRDFVGFEAECVQARQMGFDGKTLIHPGQVEICHRVFSPSSDEIEQATRVIDAFEKAEAEGQGVATVEGRMVEKLHVDEARRVLTLARDLPH